MIHFVTFHFLVDLTAGTVLSVSVDQSFPLRTVDDEELTPEQRRSALDLVTSPSNRWPGWTFVKTPDPS